MIITVEDILALEPCLSWTRDRIRWYIGEGIELDKVPDVLRQIEHEDALWVLASLLSYRLRIEWVCLCASRVLKYVKSEYREFALAAVRAAREVARYRGSADFILKDKARVAGHNAFGYQVDEILNVFAYAAYTATGMGVGVGRYTISTAVDAGYGAYVGVKNAAVGAGLYEKQWQIETACMLLKRGERSD
jgi:hypothetical protein